MFEKVWENGSIMVGLQEVRTVEKYSEWNVWMFGTMKTGSSREMVQLC